MDPVIVPLLVLGGLALVQAGAADTGTASDKGRGLEDSDPRVRIADPRRIDPRDVRTIPVSTVNDGGQNLSAVADGWPDLVTYPGAATYPDRPVGLLAWSVRLRPRAIATRNVGGVRVRDPRVVAASLGLRPSDLDKIAAVMRADPNLTATSRSRPLARSSGLAWPSWVDRYPPKGGAWIVRAGTYSVPWRGSDVLAIVPFLSRSQIAALLGGRNPIGPEDLWRIYLAALTYWHAVAGTPSPAEQAATWWRDVFGQTYFGGGLDRDPASTPTSEAVGWFGSLVVGPTATFLAAYSGAAGGGST